MTKVYGYNRLTKWHIIPLYRGLQDRLRNIIQMSFKTKKQHIMKDKLNQILFKCLSEHTGKH